MSTEEKKGGWGNLSKKKDEPSEPIYDKSTAKLIFESSKKREVRSSICAAVYGFDGTGKTGAALDCRTPEEIKEGKMVIVFDLDDGAGPDKDAYWDNDENIVILSPTEITEAGDIDYLASINKLKALVSYVKTEVPEEKIKAVVLDGLDTLKKWAMYKMKLDIGLDLAGGTRIDQKEWERRNFAFLNIVIPLKNMNCDRYFITHLKAVKEYRRVGDSTQLVVVDWVPDWLEGTPGMMFQKIRCERIESPDGKVVLKAKLEKCKTDLSREGKEIVLAEIDPKKGTSKWTPHAFHTLMVG